MEAYVSFCNSCYLALLGDGLDSLIWSYYEEKDVGFYICEHLKMTLYSQIRVRFH